MHEEQPADSTAFDPPRRAAQKQAARQRDLDDLRAGRVSAEELRERNGDVARALRGARIDVTRIRSLG